MPSAFNFTRKSPSAMTFSDFQWLGKHSILSYTIKKTYKILVVIVVMIIFFWGYNVCILDRSLANLRLVLDNIKNIQKLKEAKGLSGFLDVDLLNRVKVLSRLQRKAQRLASALQYLLLQEITNEKFPNTNLLMLELVKDYLVKLKSISQIEDAKFILKEIIEQKEKQRQPVLLFLDKINSAVVPRVMGIPKRKLQRQLGILQERLSMEKDNVSLQDSYYKLGNTYIQLLEFKRAKEAYRKAIDLNPRPNLALKFQFNLAWIEKFQGNLDEAIKQYGVLFQSAEQQEVAFFSQYQIADSLSKKGEYGRAIAIYQQIFVRQPGQGLAQLICFQLNYNYLYNLKDYGQTKKILQESRELFKGSALATYIENEMIPNLAIEQRKEGFGLLSDGYKLYLPEKYKQAQDLFDRALEINAGDGISYSGKALISLWLNNPDEALRLAREGVKLSPRDEITSVNLGYIYLQLNLVDEAITEYRRLISINPSTWRSYYNLGCAYAAQNKFVKAALAFRKATRIDPKFTPAFNNQGLCLWWMKEYAEAIKVLKKATEIDPDFLDALFNLGSAYKIMGRYREAKNEFEKILKINSAYADAQGQLKEIERITQK